ncbi:MAG TPA: PAS domain S-box protein [Burkholderiales bacterium]|nr:PAS domain S-box protein [Burkholderiales bacterium]
MTPDRTALPKEMDKPIRVLHVEDDPADRERVRRVLMAAGGFEVAEATRARDFERLLAEGEWDCVLTDIQLSGYTGLDVLDRVNAMQLGIPVVFLAGGGAEEVAVEAMKRGAADYVLKVSTHYAKLPLVLGNAVAANQAREARARTQKALEQSETAYRQLFQANPHPMWIYDAATLAFLEVNEAAVRKYGWSRAEFLGMTIKDIRPPEDVPRLLSFVERGDDKAGGNVWRHLRKDGEMLYVEVISHTLDWEGRRARVVLVNDVTERVQVEEEVRETLAELNTVHEAAPVGIALVSNRTVLRGNRTMSDITGYSREEMMLLPAERLFVSADAASRFFDVAAPQIAGAGQVSLEPEFLCRDGSRRAVRITARVIESEAPWKGEVWVVEDLESTRQAESALGRLAQDLAESQRVGRLGSWSRNFVTGEVIYSAEQYRLLELDPSSPPPRTTEDFLNLLHPETRPAMAEAYRRLRETGEPVDVEFAVPLAEGGARWVHAAMRAERGPDGRVVRAFGINQDITVRKRAEEAVRNSESRLKRVLEAMPVLLDAFDGQGNIVLWNAECERVTGYGAEEIIGNPRAMELLYPDAAYRERMVAEMNAREGSYRDWEWRVTAKDGSERYVLWSNLSREHPIEGWATWGTGVDITARRRAERRVEESEMRFRTLIDSAGDGIFITEPDGRIVDFNNAACESLGYTCEELLRMNVRDIDPVAAALSAEDLRRYHEQAMKQTVLWDGVHVRKDGSSFPVQVRISGVEVAGRKYAVGIARNMEARRRIEEALQESEERFRALVEECPDFIAVIDDGARVKFVSPSVSSVLGREPMELLGRSGFDHVHPDDLALAQATFAELRAREGEIRRLQLRLVAADGGIRELDLMVRNLFHVPAVGGLLVFARELPARPAT